jgi:hypothetical protein
MFICILLCPLFYLSSFCVLSAMLPVSLGCPFVSAPSVFSKVYLWIGSKTFIFAMFYITFYFYHNYISSNIWHHNGLLGIARIWYHLRRRNQDDILKMRYNHLFVPGENHRLVASHWQTLSQNVINPTTIRSRPRLWLYRDLISQWLNLSH